MQNPTARGTGCTVQVLDGSFCDSDEMPDAPFPICAHHARRLFEHMAYVLEQESRQPYRRQEAVVAFIDAQRQAAGQSDSSGRPLISQVYYLMIDGMVKIGTTDAARLPSGLTTDLVGSAAVFVNRHPAPPSVVCAHRSGGNTGGGSAATGEVDVTVTEEPAHAELVEAHVRLLMAKRAAMPRTWETRNERAILAEDIDEGLDRWLDR